MSVMNNKKILIATGIFPPDIGGPATYVLTLLNELPKHNYDLKVITYSDENKSSIRNSKFSILNSQICKVSRKQNIIKRYWKYFIKTYLLLGDTDLVYVQGPVSEGLPAWLACKLRGKPYLLKVVGDYAWESLQNSEIRNKKLEIFKTGGNALIDPIKFQSMKFGFKTELLRKIEHLVAKGAKKVITPSGYLKNIVKQWGVEDKKIKVIYNAISNGSIPPALTAISPVIPAPPSVIPAQAGIQGSKEEGLDPRLHGDDKGKNKGENIKRQMRKELGLEGFILLTVGRLVPWKGIDTLIDLMPELLVIGPYFKLVIAGDGPEKKNLELRIKKLESQACERAPRQSEGFFGVREKIIMTGSIDKERVHKYMCAADLFALNTGYEGLSHVIIEAMQAGLPIITTNIGGNPELIEDGKNGILVEYNNKEQIKEAILKIKTKPELTDNFREANQIKLQNFTKEKMIEGLIKELNY